MRKEPKCEPLLQEATPLSFKKLVTLFMLVLGGGILALFLLALEIIFPKCLNWGTNQEVDFDTDEDVIKAFALIESKLNVQKDTKMAQIYLDMTLEDAIMRFGLKIR